MLLPEPGPQIRGGREMGRPRDTACSPASGYLGRQGPGPQAIILSSRPLDLALLVDVHLEIASVRRR
jgi:hypothetical protein